MSATSIELDALIVGGGFAGAYQLKHLQEEGFNVKLVDEATSWGGVWYWNRYPGARVDSAIPHYEFSDPGLWKTWRWKQRFPGCEEILQYFEFIAEQWDLDRDAYFSTRVTAAIWDERRSRWYVKTNTERSFDVKFLLLNIGFAAKRYIPDWPGRNDFKGMFVHPSYWPKERPDLAGKSIAIIGTGATGIQLAQELAKGAGQLVLFQRTPNTALPMKQINFARDEQPISYEEYPEFFLRRYANFGGFTFEFLPRNTFDDSQEERQKLYEELWAKGDFHFWLGTYHDMLFDTRANKAAYDFWKAKVRARLSNPDLHEILAPDKQPYSFGCKRISLENGFYEIFNEPNTSIVDLRSTPILRITPKGILTAEKEFQFDYIICATGFDAFTGGLTDIDIVGVGGQKLAEKWRNGTKTYLGMSVAGFPNMFFTYGPQAPTAFCNGPTCAEMQGDWIVDMMNHMRKDNKTTIEPRHDDEEKWVEDIMRFANASLLPSTKSVCYTLAHIVGL
jgi:cation diffusion facilitator CzcD-associated flavoprotein CzcO